MNKFNSLAEGDAELMHMVSPRLRVAKAAFAAKTGMDPFLLIGDRQLVTLATAIEFTGAALFVADFALGAKMLMLFILVVTPVMHPYWSHEPGSAEASVDMIDVLQERVPVRRPPLLRRHAARAGGGAGQTRLIRASLVSRRLERAGARSSVPAPTPRGVST